MCDQPSKEFMRTFQISMLPSMIAAIDRIARQEKISRAEVIRRFSKKGLAAKQREDRRNE